MHERHELQQYFFVPETVDRLAELAARFANPCCVCAPMVGAALAERDIAARVLDVDERFAETPGFLHWDVYRPRALDEQFGLIVCDPPFDRVSLAQLFSAIRTLARGDYTQPLLVCYPRERGVNLTATFARFELVPTGFCPKYQTVQHGADQIEFFGNLAPALHADLARP